MDSMMKTTFGRKVPKAKACIARKNTDYIDFDVLEFTLGPDVILEIKDIIQIHGDEKINGWTKSKSEKNSVGSNSSLDSMNVNYNYFSHHFRDQISSFQKSEEIKSKVPEQKSIYTACVSFLEKCTVSNGKQKLKERIRKNIEKTLMNQTLDRERCCVDSRVFPKNWGPNEEALEKVRKRFRQKDIQIIDSCGPKKRDVEFLKEMMFKENDEIDEVLQKMFNDSPAIMTKKKEKITEMTTILKRMVADTKELNSVSFFSF